MPRSAAAERRRRQPLESNVLLTATLCLLAFGAVMVYSASSARTLLEGTGDGSDYLVRYVAYGAVGVLLMQVLARRRLDLVVKRHGPAARRRLRVPAGRQDPRASAWRSTARGAGSAPGRCSSSPRRWPSWRSSCTRRGSSPSAPAACAIRARSRPLLLVAGVAILLVASQPDLGTALVMIATVGALLVAAGLPGRHLAAGVAGAAGLVLVYALSAEYRRERLMTFLDPWDHAADAGFQAVQGQIALGSGGLLGRGLGQSLQKNLFLPEAHTDFILAIIGEELGVAGVFALVFLYGLLAYAGLRVARRASGAYAKLLAAGVTSLILCQALLNMFAILGLAPLTGVPLPFISYGSTNLIVLLGGVGLLLNVSGGGSVHLRALSSTRRDRAGSARGRDVPDRSRRDRRARGARAGGRRRAAG